jgi:ubiquinone/menaquinone biosynthesis C-methylase UbiE
MTPAGPSHLLTQQEKQARIYEEAVYPLIGQKLADLLTHGVSFPPAAHVLQIGCGMGTTTTDLLRRMDPEGRLIAIEPSAAFVERARGNAPAEYLGRRVFFRSHEPTAKLPFSDNAFDSILANVQFPERSSPAALLADAARLTKPGGKFRLSTLVTGTWREFLDIYSDVLVRLHKDAVSAALAEYEQTFPEPEALAKQLEAAGFVGVEVETTHWELVFRSAREFFYAPVIERGPLGRWKALAGKGPEMQDIFFAVKQAIDTYFGRHPFSVTLVGGIFSGTRQAPEAGVTSR